MKRLKMKKRFNEGVHPHNAEEDVPVTEQEELLCKYIPDEVEEFCRKNGLEVTCGANWHNPGEEQHIEIFVGIPEGDDPTDPKYDNIEENLEMLVNGIGDAENEGEKWGDASFQWISDEELFGELWPLEGELAEESSGVEVPDDAVKVVADRAIELLESLGKSKNVIMYLIDPERTAVGGENTSELRNMVENRLWDWIEGDMPRNGNADYTLTELYEMIKSGEL